MPPAPTTSSAPSASAAPAASSSTSASTASASTATTATTAAAGGTTNSKRRSTAPKRGAIACVRCKERKAKCVPAPHGTSPVPTCTNCQAARKECVYLERTPNEIFLLEYVSQLETRCAALEMELRKIDPSSRFSADHATPLAPAEARSAAVDRLNKQYPPAPAQTAHAQAAAGAEAQSAQAAVQPTGADSDPDEEEDLATTIGMISLGGGEEPVYVGPSSGVNWARVCATALRRPLDRARPSHLSRFSYLAPPEVASVQSALEYTLHHPTPPLPPPALASHYLSVVYEHVQARYGCFDWRTVHHWHENRQSICQGRPLWGVGTGQDEIRSLAAFFLWLCYGYGARLTEDDKLEGAVSHEVYYNAAVACLSTLTSHHSLATVQALILLVIYGFRHPTAEVSVWQVGGLAMRTALELGLHRRTRLREEREKDPFRYEMKKRVFWAVYSLDRILSAQLGRPSGIQDRDIDIELPLNIAVDCTDLQPRQLAAMQTRQIEMMDSAQRRPGDEYTEGYGNLTSMTSALHNIRLNQLKHLIQDAIYRLDKPLRARARDSTSPEREDIPEVDILLSKLGQWRACHPVPQEGVQVPLLSVEHFELEYHNCVQLLLRPIIGGRRAASRYISLCLETAASLCETQASYLQPPVTISKLSTWRFYRLFLAGMTILHILSTFYPSLSDVDRKRAQNAITRCSLTLSIFGSRFRGAARHEKLFRELVAACAGRIQAGDLQAQPVSPGQQDSELGQVPPSQIAMFSGPQTRTNPSPNSNMASQSGNTTARFPYSTGPPQYAQTRTQQPYLDQNSIDSWHSRPSGSSQKSQVPQTQGQAQPQDQGIPMQSQNPQGQGLYGHSLSISPSYDIHRHVQPPSGSGGAAEFSTSQGGEQWTNMLNQMNSGMKDEFFSLINSVKMEPEPEPSSNFGTSFSALPTSTSASTSAPAAGTGTGTTAHLSHPGSQMLPTPCNASYPSPTAPSSNLSAELDWNLFSLSPSSGQVGSLGGGIPFDLGGFGLGVGEVVGEGVGDGGFDYAGGLAWGNSLPPLGVGPDVDMDMDMDLGQPGGLGGLGGLGGFGGLGGLGGGGAGSDAGLNGGISEWFSAFDQSPTGTGGT